MSNHTPGPWTISEINVAGDVDPWYIFIEPNIAVIERKTNPEQDMPDARLIAAAPELLEALQQALPDLHGHWLMKARAAIAKATGTADE